MERTELRSILSHLAPAGPGLYAPDGADPERYWRSLTDAPATAAASGEIREEGERLLREPIPALTEELFLSFERTGVRLDYERVYFARRRRLNTFALLSWMRPERADDLAAWAEIASEVCAERTWCLPAHVKGLETDGQIDLFAAETGFTLAEMLAIGGDRLPPALRERIRGEIEARLFTPYLTRGPYGWETAKHNWSAVCAGSIGSAALLLLSDPERMTDVVGRVIDSMDCFLAGYGEDGACPEGLGYWNYGFGYFVYFADLLRRRTRGAIDLLAAPKVGRIALFQQRCYLAGDRTANFSDALPAFPVQIGLSDYLAARYPEVSAPPRAIRAKYTDDACSRFAHALRNLIWARPNEQAADWPSGSWYLPNAAWLVSRHAEADGSYGFAAKGGHNDEPHNHADVGHFILLADEEPAFAADLGSGEYTASSFGEGRYAYACNGPQGHSLPIVDGRLQQIGANRAAVVLESAAEPAEDRLALELAGTYGHPGLRSLVRRFVWRKSARPTLMLTDEYDFAASPDRVTERLVSRTVPEPAEPGVILLRGERRSVRLAYDADILEPEIASRVFRNHFGADERYYTIDLHVRKPVVSTLRIALNFQFL
ncbi:hypothetical protein [Cohnella sp. REN36]|uniref:hypothetical protein n=1 Tax=Cohnella sp. REN36 TaxID=2887347 RepID=UPI001D157D22|nr:hypothetical protein [Cohnella sp. REN36]MCC3375762.1 hypothetical protein [Cohnella sp. REN36]